MHKRFREMVLVVVAFVRGVLGIGIGDVLGGITAWVCRVVSNGTIRGSNNVCETFAPDVFWKFIDWDVFEPANIIV